MLSEEVVQRTREPRAVPMHRIVVTEMVYHQVHGYDPVVIESRFGRRISQDDHAYGPHHIQVGESWQPVDLGWIEHVGMIVLVNESNRHQTVLPSYEERVLEVQKVVEWGIQYIDHVVEVGEIAPGESQRFNPIHHDGKQLRIRCRKGVARIAVTILPG